MWYFGEIWYKVTKHGVADINLALGNSGEPDRISLLPGELR